MINFKKFKDQRVNLVSLGEVLFDIINGQFIIGGAPANLALWCKRQNINAIVISAVGKDDLGFKARDILASKYLPALMVAVDNKTGRVDVKLDDNGVANYKFIDHPAYESIPFTKEIEQVCKESNIFCYSTLSTLGSITKETLNSIFKILPTDSIKFYDVNLRKDKYHLSDVDLLVKKANIVKCNEDELVILAKLAKLNDISAANYYKYLLSIGVEGLIVTKGEQGSEVFLNNEYSQLNVKSITIADTVGAGDSFSATLLSQLSLGKSLKQSHLSATNIASYVCTKYGAMPDISNKNLQELIV